MNVPFVTSVEQLLYPEAIRYLVSTISNVYFTEAAVTLIRTLTYKTLILVNSFNDGLSLQNWINSGYFQPVTTSNISRRLAGIIEVENMKIIIIQEFLIELINFTLGEVQRHRDNIALIWDVYEGIANDYELATFFRFDPNDLTLLTNFWISQEESKLKVGAEFVCGAILGLKLLNANYSIRIFEIPLDITEISRTTRFWKPDYPNCYSVLINDNYYYFTTPDFMLGLEAVGKYLNYDFSNLISDYRRL